MRNRFFVIILAALVLAAIAINLVHVNFFKSQRLKLIDRQIAESSTTLLNSEEFAASLNSPGSLEDKISKVLGGSRIGKVFVLRGKKGDVIYQSENLNVLQVELPMSPEWVTVEAKDQHIRIRNTAMGEKLDRVFQVGLVLDRNFINWEILDARTGKFIAGIVIATFFAAVFLTLLLLSPLRVLNSHLSQTTMELSNLRTVESLPGFLEKYTGGFLARSDEFADLIQAIQKLIDRINLNYKLTRSWTLQLAHELKTPLAVITAITESHVKNGKIPQRYSDDVMSEVQNMSTMINEFLDWAEVEASGRQKDLHSVRVVKAVRSIIARMENLEPGRIHVKTESEFSVFASPSHVDQLVTNLLTNALKFSPKNREVIVTVKERTLTVEDRGGGVSSEVIERLGEPFNVGSSDGNDLVGNGLGLAWVVTVAKLYHWNFQLQTSGTGTIASVKFPDGEI